MLMADVCHTRVLTIKYILHVVFKCTVWVVLMYTVNLSNLLALLTRADPFCTFVVRNRPLHYATKIKLQLLSLTVVRMYKTPRSLKFYLYSMAVWVGFTSNHTVLSRENILLRGSHYQGFRLTWPFSVPRHRNRRVEGGRRPLPAIFGEGAGLSWLKHVLYKSKVLKACINWQIIPLMAVVRFGQGGFFWRPHLPGTWQYDRH